MADSATTPLGPPDARQVPRFAGPETFARLTRLGDVGCAAVAVAGIPFDSGVSYRPGARFGPGSVRAGSKLLRPYHPGLDVQPWARHQVADAGDIPANPFDLRDAISQIEAGAREVLGSAEHDVVEVAPAYDHAELTSLAAANAAYELLSLLALRAGTR